MKIEQIQTAAFRCPLASPWGDQTHQVTHIELVVTDITSDTGLIGTGFSYSVGVGAKAIHAMIDWYIAPKLIGSDIAPRVLWDRMWAESHDAGGGGISTMAIAAVDIALWDLSAKAAGQSLVSYLGQYRNSIPAYGSGINLNLSQHELEEQVRRWFAGGYHAAKVKVGKPELAEDVERLAAVRRVAGAHRRVMVDANQGWNITQAIQAFEAFDSIKLHWIEEPLLADDIEGHGRLRSHVKTPVALGENLYNRYQFNEYFSRGACDFVQADVVRVGGITPFLAIASLAHAWNLPMAPHFLFELSGQLLCCIPNAHILEDVEGGSLGELGVLSTAISIKDGMFTPPANPGHGIVFDRERLARHRLGDQPPTRAESLWRKQ